MLLFSWPRSGHRQRAALPLLAAVLLCVVPAAARPSASSQCPHIDCAKARREVCKPGSSHCGPCHYPLEENEEGRCVTRRRHHPHGKETSYPDLDEEIDILHSYIEKQELVGVKPTKKKPKASVVATSWNATTKGPHATASMTPQPRVTGPGGRVVPIFVPGPKGDSVVVTVIISLCVAVGSVAVILATVCYIKLQRESRLAQKVDYPAYGGGGSPPDPPNGTAMGDKTLAQSAQMYHYQHQKQQMLSMANHKPEQKAVDSEVTSDEEEVGGDFTVYECPGLAPTGEMEVKNPLFDDSTMHYQGSQK